MSRHSANTKDPNVESVPTAELPEGTPELTEVERTGEMPIVDTVADGEGDATHETKASTLEKQKVDEILDEEEAREREKHTKKK
ncbi:hypothetical protein BWI93_21405 [Siphonobacter sp. BAB-5385]|nr:MULTISPECIES: hypothetical protein [Siphonobacter]OZI06074.1 hypothetical protein BWI93_21405 [Siphonobacter sp. BAB-5385]PMD95344.1 hypothetical protein BWI97_15085 [Siphonobacter sp. BAB-5405]